jgi:hypothetical protein
MAFIHAPDLGATLLYQLNELAKPTSLGQSMLFTAICRTAGTEQNEDPTSKKRDTP